MEKQALSKITQIIKFIRQNSKSSLQMKIKEFKKIQNQLDLLQPILYKEN